MPLPNFPDQFTHDFQLCSFLADFLTAHIFIWPAEPAQSCPSLKRVLNKCCAVCGGDGTPSESQFDGTLNRFTATQRAEKRKFFRLDAAKIDGEIQTMNCQKDLRRFKLRDGPDLTAFSPFLNGVAGKISRVVAVFHFQEQVVHRIVQLEELHIGLNAKVEIRYLNLTEILGAKGGFCLTVEGFDVCPLETNHIEGKHPLIAYPTRILAQPGFQVRAQISECERARRTFRK